ncbi:heme A synthase [Flaviflexus salsibiostraticola]|uniref:Heme A synthase n=1 Tax=Flaviflexus salsibiostraticola TaxID=1282737 RepID=A0A3Q8WSE6_9ACTO|nr:COX15/CtaA family protein [Flaviflexus salsibiostraticola]AZN29163.1 heme A synthase [Flaviflexus salsibiostraticola]
MHVDRTTRNLAIANLVAQIGIIITGGLVRLTGSGLGCSQWPLCEPGQFTPQFREESSIHPYIEFGNRTLTGVLGIIAVLLIIAVYRRQPTRSRPQMKRLAWWPLIGIIVQAIIGGITVWVDLHPAVVGLHMLISLSLVAVSAYIIWRLHRPDSEPSLLLPQAKTLTYAVSLSAALLVILGTVVTGAGPHSGDATEPYRWGMDTVMISRVHALSAWLFTAVAVTGLVLLIRRRREAPSHDLEVAIRAWSAVLGVTLLNGIIGYVQHATNLPEPLVLAHMLGSALLVASVAYATSALHPRSIEHRGRHVASESAAARQG